MRAAGTGDVGRTGGSPSRPDGYLTTTSLLMDGTVCRAVSGRAFVGTWRPPDAGPSIAAVSNIRRKPSEYSGA